MPENITRKEEQRGTRKLMMWGAVVIALIFCGILAASVIGAMSQ